jgi:hypothetical protein
MLMDKRVGRREEGGGRAFGSPAFMILICPFKIRATYYRHNKLLIPFGNGMIPEGEGRGGEYGTCVWEYS